MIGKLVLERIGADTDTPFDVSLDGQVLILSTVKVVYRGSAFQTALDKANARYPKALKKLSK